MFLFLFEKKKLVGFCFYFLRVCYILIYWEGNIVVFFDKIILIIKELDLIDENNYRYFGLICF